MTGIVQSLENLVSSFFALLGNVMNGILSAFQSVVAVVYTIFQQLAGLVKDALMFVLDNIVILGVIAAAVAGFFALQQRQGGQAIGQKKRA